MVNSHSISTAVSENFRKMSSSLSLFSPTSFLFPPSSAREDAKEKKPTNLVNNESDEKKEPQIEIKNDNKNVESYHQDEDKFFNQKDSKVQKRERQKEIEELGKFEGIFSLSQSAPRQFSS